MNLTTILKASMALPLVALLALSACGGGGGGPTTTPGTGGGQPGTGGGQPGTGGGQPGAGGGQLPAATQPAKTLAQLIPDPTNTFEALSKSLHRDFSASTASTTDRLSVSSVASDGAGGFHVTYVLDGAEKTVHFSSADFGTTSYTKAVDGQNFGLWSYSGTLDGVNYGESSEFEYFYPIGGYTPDGLRFHSSYGVRTGSDGMPGGTGTYAGRMYSEAFDNSLDTIALNAARSRVAGRVVLTADFSAATLSGRIFRLRVRAPGESTYSGMPSTTRFEITGGAIADDTFTATLTGVDDNADAALSDSMRGFSGDVQGQFYGPDASEFAGVLHATRAAGADDDWAMVGWLGGKRTNVVGEHTDNEPLSAGVDRLDYSSASPRIASQDATNRITGIAADASGGYTISYLVDGTPQTVSLSVDDLGAGLRTEAYWKRTGTSGWFFRRSYSLSAPQGRYYRAKEWALVNYPDDTSFASESSSWVSIVHGERTAAASIPQAGTATYAGKASAFAFNPSPGQGLASSAEAEGYNGRLTLSADFAAGSVSGSISDLEHSPKYFETGSYQAVPGQAFTIADGTIQGNALSGSLSGLGYSGTVSGAFYGPAVDEAAGVMQATGADGKLLHGWFGGTRQ